MAWTAIFNPTTLLIIFIAVLYFTGGLDIIFNNPIFIIFIGLGFLVLKFAGGKR